MTDAVRTENATRMDRKLKTKWLRALRSGEFLQGQKQLVTDTPKGTAYCCLGLLEHLCGTRRAELERFNDKAVIEKNERCIYRGVPQEVRSRLADMNDGNKPPFGSRRPKSFKEIAAWIEKNL